MRSVGATKYSSSGTAVRYDLYVRNEHPHVSNPLKTLRLLNWSRPHVAVACNAWPCATALLAGEPAQVVAALGVSSPGPTQRRFCSIKTSHVHRASGLGPQSSMTTPTVPRPPQKVRRRRKSWRLPQLLRKRDLDFLASYLFGLGVLAAYVWFLGFDWSSVLVR